MCYTNIVKADDQRWWSAFLIPPCRPPVTPTAGGAGRGAYMAKDFAKAFYRSKAWQRCRDEYAKSVGHLCERCLAQGTYKPGEIVHHKVEITPDTIGKPAVTLAWENLELVCRDCHAKLHGSTKRYKVDEMGRVIVNE